jgi:hypothetical protein
LSACLPFCPSVHLFIPLSIYLRVYVRLTSVCLPRPSVSPTFCVSVWPVCRHIIADNTRSSWAAVGVVSFRVHSAAANERCETLGFVVMAPWQKSIPLRRDGEPAAFLRLFAGERERERERETH